MFFLWILQEPPPPEGARPKRNPRWGCGQEVGQRGELDVRRGHVAAGEGAYRPQAEMISGDTAQTGCDYPGARCSMGRGPGLAVP